MTEPKKVRVKVDVSKVWEIIKTLDLNPGRFFEVELDATLVEKEEWPKWGDIYYKPAIFAYIGDRFDRGNFGSNEYDDFYFKNNLACKTKEEAIELANYLIEKAKEWKRPCS